MCNIVYDAIPLTRTSNRAAKIVYILTGKRVKDNIHLPYRSLELAMTEHMKNEYNKHPIQIKCVDKKIEQE